mmetsp:Transcript_18340/g.28583  ORF Transcript_18340/g.28583 Transcript_18340/m.28583 type:complete len:140 (+) Transcript_18340:373-792(+)
MLRRLLTQSLDFSAAQNDTQELNFGAVVPGAGMASSGPAITMKTHLDDPDVPDGWVRHTEPSGRIYYTSEMAAGVNTKLELKEKTYQEEYEISDSEGSEDSFTFEPYEQDSEEFAVRFGSQRCTLDSAQPSVRQSTEAG